MTGQDDADQREEARLAELDRFQVLDSASEAAFDELVAAAAAIARTPAAAVSLVDEHRQWFKAYQGLSGPGTPRSDAFCDLVVQDDAEVIIGDTLLEARLADNPDVGGGAQFRFYAGFPLRTPSGAVLGTLCVIDHEPRALTPDQLAVLRTLADQVMAQLRLRRELRERDALLAQREEVHRRLEESEKRYRFLVENSSDVIAQHRPDGSVSYVSPTVQGLLGVTPHSPDDWNLADRVHPDDVPGYTESYLQAMSGQATTATGRIRHADGEYRYIETTLKPVLGEDGSVIELLATSRDVTERHQAQEALNRTREDLARQRELLELAQELAEIGSWAADLSTNEVSWSREAHRIFGTDPQMPLDTETIWQYVHPDDHGIVKSAVGQAFACGRSDDVEFRAIRDDDQARILRSRYRVEKDADGVPLRLSGTVLDITETRSTELELVRARDLLQQVMSTATKTAIIGTGPDGLLTIFNRGAQNMLGYSAGEMVGTPGYLRFHELAEIAERGARYGVPPASGDVFVRATLADDDEWTFIRKDGTRLRGQLSVSPLVDSDGEPAGFIGFMVDVTQARQAERELLEARDQALAANQAKSAFLATMSHEIRTPMNAVIGMTGLLLDTTLDDDQRDLVETVRGSGDQLLAIINDILDFSKIEAGDLDLERRAFDLRDLVEDTVAQFAGSARGLDLISHVDAECPVSVVGDVTRLRQVLSNLIGNAIKFTTEGDVLVRVRCGDAGEDAGDDQIRLAFAVQDTGIGIPAESMHRLFKSFSQVDASTTRNYGGTGLGLAISKALVTAMGGEIAVESELGAGSTFSFTAVVGADPSVPELRPGRMDTAALKAAMAGRRVLIVDDNATNRRILTAQLGSHDVETAEAGSPIDALRLLSDATQRFDLAILDLAMPVLDGVQLATAIRRLPAHAKLPLLLLSSLGHRLGPDEQLFAAVLTKPVRGTALLENVARSITASVQPDLAAGPPASSAGSSALPGSGAVLPAPAGPRDDGVDSGPAQPVLRILLAEDNEVNQKVGRLMLAKMGHDAVIVSNGEQAFEAVRDQDYDVVLMDMHMPVMDGLEATRRIRAELPAGRQPWIVALTASVTMEDRDACAEAGMNSYLSKPVRPGELASMLAQAAAVTHG